MSMLLFITFLLAGTIPFLIVGTLAAIATIDFPHLLRTPARSRIVRPGRVTAWA